MPSPAGRVAPTPPQAYIPQPSPMFGATVDPRLSDISDVQVDGDFYFVKFKVRWSCFSSSTLVVVYCTYVVATIYGLLCSCPVDRVFSFHKFSEKCLIQDYIPTNTILRYAPNSGKGAVIDF